MSVIENWWTDLVAPLLLIVVAGGLVALYLFNIIPEKSAGVILTVIVSGVFTIVPYIVYYPLFKNPISQMLFIAGMLLIILSVNSMVFFQLFRGKPIVSTILTPQSSLQSFNKVNAKKLIIETSTDPLMANYKSSTFAIRISRGNASRVIEGEFIKKSNNLRGKKVKVVKKSENFEVSLSGKDKPLVLKLMSKIDKGESPVVVKIFGNTCPCWLIYIAAFIAFILFTYVYRLEWTPGIRMLVPHSGLAALILVILLSGKLTAVEPVRIIFGNLIVSLLSAGLVGELVCFFVKKRNVLN